MERRILPNPATCQLQRRRNRKTTEPGHLRRHRHEDTPDARSGIGDPEAKFTTANDREHPAGRGVFKPQHDRDRGETDSPNASDAPTATEEKQEDAGTRTPEETPARGLPRHPVRRAGGNEVHRPATL
ncbi:hypothetical protein NDU88_002089 [Pleurodeles waltl]|uniref:Uncharacterized protein n=1 Tax=Pleurodeles waltl TaxID=8319 RepID=A0AAV7P5S6_PLEWA|nr:hypothetical protein NDU88_002089 [Pleurodeles waltl]